MPSLSTVRSTLASLKLRSPTIVCVGGTSGIGEAIARRLTSLSSAPRVHLVGRNVSVARKIIDDLKRINPDGFYEFHACDLTLVSDTKRLVAELSAALPRVDYLVLSQGILTMAGRTETSEGNDRKMMLHYYSRMEIIDGLQGSLAAAEGGARVMSVLDSTRGNPSNLIWDDLDLRTHYSLKKAADHCMTMNDLSVQYLGGRTPAICYYHAYPGVVKTPISSSLSWAVQLALWPVVKMMAVEPDVCADYLLYAFLAKDPSPYKVGAGFYTSDKGDPVKGKKESDSKAIRTVWDHTTSLLGI